MVQREWLLKRNCSVAPHQLVKIFTILCATSLTIALFFTLHGAWYSLFFSVLELSAVGFAFLIYARYATDREYLAIVENYLLVEVVLAGEKSCFKLDLHQVRIEPMRPGKHLVTLVSSGTRIDVGRYLTEWKRREFAQQLERAVFAGCDVG